MELVQQRLNGIWTGELKERTVIENLNLTQIFDDTMSLVNFAKLDVSNMIHTVHRRKCFLMMH